MRSIRIVKSSEKLLQLPCLRDLKADRSKHVSLKILLAVMKEGVKLQSYSAVSITVMTGIG
jgi:hypothetical protein